eukprot:jgi/Tetstr1/434781/TSEL_023832.t1
MATTRSSSAILRPHAAARASAGAPPLQLPRRAPLLRARPSSAFAQPPARSPLTPAQPQCTPDRWGSCTRRSAPMPPRAAEKGAGEAAAEDSPEADDSLQYSRAFLVRRWITFVGIVLGYACYYLTRNSLTYTAPVMVADPLLGMDITMIGAMTSIFPIAYGMSKFVSGVLGARISPAKLLAGGLIATAVVNVAFGFGASLAWFCFFWAMNGVLQGLGGPCCARILTAWFATK